MTFQTVQSNILSEAEKHSGDKTVAAVLHSIQEAEACARTALDSLESEAKRLREVLDGKAVMQNRSDDSRLISASYHAAVAMQRMTSDFMTLHIVVNTLEDSSEK